MLKVLQSKYIFCINGQPFFSQVVGVHIGEEKEIEEIPEYFMSWDNLDEFLTHFGLIFPGNVWNTKKGRKIIFFKNFYLEDTKKKIKAIKEWEGPIPISVKIKTRDVDSAYNIHDILKIRDKEKVIKYLRERNLEIKGE